MNWSIQAYVVNLKRANRSLVHPKGKIDDALVQVDKFVFLADFIILDFKVDADIHILLGRPFLSIGRTLIDFYKGELTVRVNDQQLKFNLPRAMGFPYEI